MTRPLVWITAVLALLFLCSCSAARKAQVKDVAEPTITSYPDQPSGKTIAVKRVVFRIPRGEHIGAKLGGVLCTPFSEMRWRSGGTIDFSDSEFVNTVMEELKKYNYRVVGDPNALFDDTAGASSELMLGAAVTDFKANICYPLIGFGNTRQVSGECSMTVEWQIASSLDRRQPVKITTSGRSNVDARSGRAVGDIYYEALGQAARGLLADPKFQAIVTGKSDPAEQDPKAKQVNPVSIAIDRVKTRPARSVAEAQLAVFTVAYRNGHASGFFISPDGYALTNFHVVKHSDKLRLVLSDRTEVLADVISRDAGRDIALIKAPTANYPYLEAGPRELPVATEVFAIGSPLDEALAGSVSKGVVSGYPTLRNNRQLQSDVTVNHGNSGGPLVQGNGKVAAVCSWGLAGDGATHLNMFIPIDDALDKLEITLR